MKFQGIITPYKFFFVVGFQEIIKIYNILDIFKYEVLGMGCVKYF